MSQEQQDQVQRVGARLIAPNDESHVQVPTRRKRSKKKTAVVSEEAIMAMSARPSFWPLALALALVVLLVGAITNVIILLVGAVLVVAAAIAWGVERR